MPGRLNGAAHRLIVDNPGVTHRTLGRLCRFRRDRVHVGSIVQIPTGIVLSGYYGYGGGYFLGQHACTRTRLLGEGCAGRHVADWKSLTGCSDNENRPLGFIQHNVRTAVFVIHIPLNPWRSLRLGGKFYRKFHAISGLPRKQLIPHCCVVGKCRHNHRIVHEVFSDGPFIQIHR